MGTKGIGPTPGDRTVAPSDIGFLEHGNDPQVARRRAIKRSPGWSRMPRLAEYAPRSRTSEPPASSSTAPGISQQAGCRRGNRGSQRRRYTTGQPAKDTAAATRIRVQTTRRFSRDSKVVGSAVETKCVPLEPQFHVKSAGDRIRAIRGDFPKADFTVHRDGIFHHWLDGVKAHALKTDLAGFGDDAVCENAT